MNIDFILVNFNYWICVILLLIGLFTTIAKENLIKKIMGVNILATSVLLFLVSLGDIEGGAAPIIVPGVEVDIYVNPLPATLVLTGIVVSVALTGFALALIIKIYEEYGTLDAEELIKG